MLRAKIPYSLWYVKENRSKRLSNYAYYPRPDYMIVEIKRVYVDKKNIFCVAKAIKENIDLVEKEGFKLPTNYFQEFAINWNELEF